MINLCLTARTVDLPYFYVSILVSFNGMFLQIVLIVRFPLTVATSELHQFFVFDFSVNFKIFFDLRRIFANFTFKNIRFPTLMVHVITTVVTADSLHPVVRAWLVGLSQVDLNMLLEV